MHISASMWSFAARDKADLLRALAGRVATV